ncbi:MAG: AIR synthase family protein [Christensenellaceae bacterium]
MLKQGKLTNTQLEELVLNKIINKNEETVVGAGIGEDCCAVKIKGGMCVVSTDPITASNEQTGELAIYINANDIAAAGAIPIAALVTLLIPPSAQDDDIKKVSDQLTSTASNMNIDIIGGHTEITDSVNRIIVSVAMIGKPVIENKMFKTSDMRIGEDILMTKYAGIEGTTIIANDFLSELKNQFHALDYVQLEEIRKSLSVVKDGAAAAKLDVSAMHDITEGGVIGAICEMCEASHTGADIDFSKVPVMDVTKKICKYYDLDVYGLISSGSMIITTSDGEAVVHELSAQGIKATMIGKVTKKGVFDVSNNKRKAVSAYQSDELYKVIEKKR